MSKLTDTVCAGVLFSTIMIGVVSCGVSLGHCAPKVHAEPPTRFNHPYKGKLVVHSVPKGSAYAACVRLNGGANPAFYKDMLGCQFGGVLERSRKCIIVVTVGKPHVTRHEIAHCNGWSAYHEQ